MSQQGLEALLRPKSIAVIGASMKPHRAGYLMMRNLLAGGFNGPVLPVTPAWKAVLGVMAWPDIASLPFTPDLAIYALTPAETWRYWTRLARKVVKRALSFLLPRHNMKNFLPVPGIIKCVCWVQTVLGSSRRGKG